jgi:serine/threonine-protein kinase
VDPARGSVLKWALPLAGVVLAVVVYLFTGKAPQEPTPVASPTAAEPTPAAAVSIAPSTVASSAKPAVSADKALAKSALRDPKKQAASAAVQAAPGTAVISAKPVAHAADAQSAADKASHEAKANETAPASTDPTKACEGRWLLGFQICMNEQCAKSAFVNHPACVERRRQEENRKAIESQKR